MGKASRNLAVTIKASEDLGKRARSDPAYEKCTTLQALGIALVVSAKISSEHTLLTQPFQCEEAMLHRVKPSTR